MTFTLTVKQISPEFWLATMILAEEGKLPTSRDFVVTEQQLAFLSLLRRAWEER